MILSGMWLDISSFCRRRAGLRNVCGWVVSLFFSLSGRRPSVTSRGTSCRKDVKISWGDGWNGDRKHPEHREDEREPCSLTNR